MGKTPSQSRKDVRSSAPYRRSKDTTPPGAAPLGKIQLIPGPAHPERSEERPVVPTPGESKGRAEARAESKDEGGRRTVAPPAAPPAPPAPAAAALLDLPMPVAAAPPPTTPPAPDHAPARGELLAAFKTSLGFASAALAALPHPAELVTGEPSAPEPPPGPAPAGDARSLRAGDQFALVYRHGAAVVSRRGKLGLRGTWNVVDYPSAALAAHAYALECSRLAAQGFRDVY